MIELPAPQLAGPDADQEAQAGLRIATVELPPARDVEQLRPRRWKASFAANPLRSDL